MASIAEAVHQAQKAAAGIIATTGADIIEGSISRGGIVTTFTKPSMKSIAANTGVIPRSTPYLKVNEDGIKIGKDKTYLEGFKTTVDLREDKGFQLKWTLRFGNPAQYLSTYDGISCDKGGSWNDAMMKARLADPNADPYPAVDVVLTLSEPLKLKDEALPAGTKIGFNSSKTNFSDWSDFYEAAADAGVTDNPAVDVQIGFREINHNGNTWGVLTLELL